MQCPRPSSGINFISDTGTKLISEPGACILAADRVPRLIPMLMFLVSFMQK